MGANFSGLELIPRIRRVHIQNINHSLFFVPRSFHELITNHVRAKNQDSFLELSKRKLAEVNHSPGIHAGVSCPRACMGNMIDSLVHHFPHLEMKMACMV